MVRPRTFPRGTLPSEDGSDLVEPDGRGNQRPRIDIARRVRGDRVVQARRGRQDPDHRTWELRMSRATGHPYKQVLEVL